MKKILIVLTIIHKPPSNERVNPDITNITNITKPDKQELTKVDTTETDQNGLEHNPKEIPPEDYETYTARQAEKVRVEREEEARRIFDRLTSKIVEENPGAEKEVLESIFREVLISSGISKTDIDVIINDMTEKDGPIERVVTELGDILRLKGDFYKNG